MSEFVEVKTVDLIGAALDWAVGYAVRNPHLGTGNWAASRDAWLIDWSRQSCYSPSSNWAQSGPLIDKYGIRLERSTNGYSWFAGRMYSDIGWNASYETFDGEDESGNSTPLIAACRAIVASVLGDTVSVPKELCQ